MNRIRSFVYWIGLTPKFGSIFYSPSRHWTMRVGKELQKAYLSFPKKDTDGSRRS